MPKPSKYNLIKMSSKVDHIITVARSYDDAYTRISKLKVCGKQIKDEKIKQLLSNRHSLRINPNLKK